MTRVECVREQELLEAIASRRWPDQSPELRAHVDACDVCRDLAIVATAFSVEQHEPFAEIPALPSAEVVWWRAQVRARADAARRASRPIVVVQSLAVASALGVIVGLAGNAAGWGLSMWTRWAASAAAALGTAAATDVAGLVLRGILLALGVWLVLAPVAVYLATDE